MNNLEALKQYTTVVADTGDFDLIEQFAPQDATTNPSLILRAVRQDRYRVLLNDIVSKNRKQPTDKLLDRLLVAFGKEILKTIPGRVSTEVDARLSFDTDATVERARRIIALYRKAGIKRSRVLIKIAATWEGIKAAEILEKEGIACNMTLIFAKAQAVACAKAKATLISPFVGRIADWYKAKTGNDFTAENDPGVASVRDIYMYYKKFGIKTEIMGASFRNTGQVKALAGCDLLTISPQLLDALSKETDGVTKQLSVKAAKKTDTAKEKYPEQAFKLAVNNNAMASEKLSEGIRQFCLDTLEVEKMIEAAR